MNLRNLFAAVLLVLNAAPALALDGEQLLREVDRNLEPASYEMYRKLINVEPNGKTKEFILYSVKKGDDKLIAVFLSPASEKGRSTLRLGDNMWLYIPEVGKPIRITSLQSVIGGVFNNADILRLDYGTEYAVETATEESDAFLLELKAKSNAVAYDRLKMWIDRTARVPITIEAYAASGLLIKTLRFKDIKDFGDGLVRPATVETDSPLYKGYKSIMLYSGIKRREVDDEVFTLNFMPRVESLR